MPPNCHGKSTEKRTQSSAFGAIARLIPRCDQRAALTIARGLPGRSAHARATVTRPGASRSGVSRSSRGTTGNARAPGKPGIFCLKHDDGIRAMVFGVADIPGAQPGLFGLIQSTGGGIRTHTLVPRERILSPQRLPFRHAGVSDDRRGRRIGRAIRIEVAVGLGRRRPRPAAAQSPSGQRKRRGWDSNPR